jgi:hypothetical protein
VRRKLELSLSAQNRPMLLHVAGSGFNSPLPTSPTLFERAGEKIFALTLGNNSVPPTPTHTHLEPRGELKLFLFLKIFVLSCIGESTTANWNIILTEIHMQLTGK